ncbi:MAG: ROK family protein, partial [Deinococcota bacterium]
AETWASDRTREQDDLNWKQWAKRVSRYLQYLEGLFSPDLFIIGGGVSKKADKWQPHVETARTRLVPAALQNEAGIVGAAMMAAQQQQQQQS